MAQDVTLTGRASAAFFSAAGRGRARSRCTRTTCGPVTVSFDRFEIDPAARAVDGQRPLGHRTNRGRRHDRRPRDTFVAADRRTCPTAASTPPRSNGTRQALPHERRRRSSRPTSAPPAAATRSSSRRPSCSTPTRSYTFEVTDGVQGHQRRRVPAVHVDASPPARRSRAVDPTLVVREGRAARRRRASSTPRVKVGPDHRLYAGTYDGRILRFTSTPTARSARRRSSRRSRPPTAATGCSPGFTFDPPSTATNLIVWVSARAVRFGHRGRYATEWTGKISRLSGAEPRQRTRTSSSACRARCATT